MDEYIIRVKVEGEFACFTRPDLKVERMTYPCMTPSAARGVLDSILWKPEFKWHVKRILVLKPVKYFSVKRNEINAKQGKNPIVIEDKRAQRNSIILRDVGYIIEAAVHIDEFSQKNPHVKYVEMFNRRVRKGQCFRRPFLGTRELPAEFLSPVDTDKPIAEDIPIGSMLLDIFYDEKGTPSPRFFYNVAVRQGVLDCAEPYKEILKSAHHRGYVSDYESGIIHELNTQEEREAGASI